MNMIHFSLAAIVAAVALEASSKTVYLDKDSKNPTAPFSSWQTAANDPATALAAADQGKDVILVAPATYNVSATLATCAYGVTVRSADKSTGEIAPDRTIFDGSDLAADSLLKISGNKGPVTLDGLTFRNARAATSGGAVYYPDWCGSIKILNCRFENNAASTSGGAVYIHVGANGGVISNCTFVGNSVTAATKNEGGGAIRLNTDEFSVIDCIASNNTVSGDHPYGGFVKSSYDITVKGGCYRDNRIGTLDSSISDNYGSGGHFQSNNGCLISDVIVEGNLSARYGGIIYGGWNCVVSNCVFRNLTGTVNYGLIHCNENSDIVGCKVLNSKAGTALSFQEWSTGKSLRNCLVTGGNTGLFHGFCGSGTVDNCTFFGNSVKPIFSTSSGTSLIRNCLLDFEGSTQDGPNGNHIYIVSNCYLTAAISGVEAPGSIIGGQSGVAVTTDGEVHLKADSCLVDKGLALDWTVSGIDINGNPRTAGTMPDIGCSERQGYEIDCQRAVANEEDRVGEWTNAFVGAEAALVGVGKGYDLLFKAGTYTLEKELAIENRGLTLKAETDGSVTFDAQGNGRCLRIRPNGKNRPVTLRGFNFVGGRVQNGDEASIYGRGAGIYAYSADESSRTTISHCLISNCLSQCSLSNAVGRARGGGICTLGQVTIEDCTVADCCASNSNGGGAYIETDEQGVLGQGPVARRCKFLRNHAIKTAGYGEPGYGGGAYSAGAVLFEDCEFTENTSDDIGGALYLGKNAWVVGSRFDGNSAKQSGVTGYVGGNVVSNCFITATKKGTCFFQYSQQPLVTHCVFSNNLTTAYLAVGYQMKFRNCLFIEPNVTAIDLNQGNCVCTAENCTFVNCKCPVSVWGYGGGNTQASLKNCLFANNAVDFNRVKDCKSNPSFMLENCCYPAEPTFSEYTSAGTVLSANPLFVDAANGDYRLKVKSPCRDKGEKLDWMTSGSVDLCGAPRVVSHGLTLADDPDAKPDIGAYECQINPQAFYLILK